MSKRRGEFLSTIWPRAMVGWSVSFLRPIRERIQEAAKALRQNPDNSGALAAIERGLAEWDEYSQPVQLKEESKGLDDPESGSLCHDLRQLVFHLANEEKKYKIALKISNALLRTFPELPAARGQLSNDIKALKKLVPSEALEAKLKPLLNLVEEINGDLAGFASAVHARNRMWSRFDQAVSMVANDRELASTEQIWIILCNVAVELRDIHEQASFLVLSHIAQQARSCDAAPRKIKEMCEQAVSNVRLDQKRQEFIEAMEREDSEAARKAVLEVAGLTKDEDERHKAQEIAGQLKSGDGGGVPWWVWLLGAAALYAWLSK